MAINTLLPRAIDAGLAAQTIKARGLFACPMIVNEGEDDVRFPHPAPCNLFWEDQGLVLAEIRRVLKPGGGRLCIYITDAATMQRWRLAGEEAHRHFTADQLTEILVGAGFALARLKVKSVAIAQGVGGIIVTACDTHPV